jgi:ATP-binding cassette, subfamily B, bacterial
VKEIARWWEVPLSYARYHRRALAGVAALHVLLALLTAALPWPTKLAIDYVLEDRELPGWAGWIDALPGVSGAVGALVALAVASVVLYGARSVLRGVQLVARRSTGQQMSLRLAIDVLARLQRRSLAQLDARPTGDLVQRVTTDSKCAEALTFGVLMTVFEAAVALLVMAVIMWLLDPALTVLALGAVLPLLVAVRGFISPMRRFSLQYAEAQGSVMVGAERMLAAVPEIQGFSREDEELRRFRGRTDEELDAGLRQQRTSLLYQLAVTAVTAAATALVLAVGGLAALNGTLTVGDLLVFAAYVTALYSPVEMLAHVMHSLSSARAGAERVVEVLGSDDEVPEVGDPVRLPAVAGGSRLVWEGVWFGYGRGEAVLRGVQLEVAAGQTVAVVGATGAGKSTLVALVPRFFDPWGGRVLIDGVDVRLAALREVRERVAIVRQEPLLLPLTIAENIAYARPEASRASIERAARDAVAHEFIERLPDGYDTVVGERGATLSGGQCQRLAIARALLKDAPILVLDEPTSALDAESEALLVAALAHAAAGRTVLVIAHRLSTVAFADRIVVLDDGRIVEDGTHDQLLANGRTYARYHHHHYLAAVANGGGGSEV